MCFVDEFLVFPFLVFLTFVFEFFMFSFECLLLRFRVMGVSCSFSSSFFLFWVLRFRVRCSCFGCFVFQVLLCFVFEFIVPVLGASFKFGILYFVFEFWTVPALFLA